MGQHKSNPTAIAAKEGKIQPKPKPIGKRERERLLCAKCQEILCKPLADAYAKMQAEEFDEYCNS